MAIFFTDRELKRAWRQLTKNSQPPNNAKRENTHRLLLFYAVECGLKIIWLQHKRKTLFAKEDIQKTGHDLAKTLTLLRAGHQLELPVHIQLADVRAGDGAMLPRHGGLESLHEIWRYGGECQTPQDSVCEQQLEQVLEWINGELR